MIGILTFHAPHNYGSSLQAYALQQKILRLGYQNEIINFRSETQAKMYSLVDTGRLKPGTILKNIDNVINIKKFLKRKRLFENFIDEKLKKSDEVWLNEQQTIERANNYSAIVCGSDQVWNRGKTTRDRSWIYYLDFPHSCRSISYAPSMGNTAEMPEEERQLKLIKAFDVVSVREKPACEYLQKKGVSCTQVLDPTLLLNKEDWIKLEKKDVIKTPYILFYSINCDRTVAKKAVMLGKKMGIPVICPTIHPRLWGTGIKFVPAGPCEFLSLIHNAQFVYTNSFHGTVFSVLYEKPFVSVLANGKKDDRRTSLLTALGLGNHIISPEKEINPNEFICKLDPVKLQELRNTSEEFLKNSLEGLA